jgi:hypothetical protein
MISHKDPPAISQDLFSNLQLSSLIHIRGYPMISFLIHCPCSGTPATAAGIGLTVCSRLGDPSGSMHAHSWPHGNTFVRTRTRSDRCGCCIVAALPACSSRWDGAMGPRLCGPPHDPYGSLDAEYQPRGTPG